MTAAPEPWLGTMNFGAPLGERESREVLDRALERGIAHVDTANLYADGASERIVGAAVRDAGKPLFVATKVGLARRDGRPEGLSGRAIERALGESLERLGLASVDLYYLHAPDARTPFGETLDALAAAFERGQVKSWGVSNFAAWQTLELATQAPAHGLPPPAVGQQLYNAIHRELDVEWLPFARAHRLRTAVYNPLAGGLLTGKHRADGSSIEGSRFDGNRFYQGRYFTAAMHARTEALAALAAEASMSLVSLSYRWLAQRPGVDAVIVGPRAKSHVDDALDALSAPLDAALAKRIDALDREWRGTDTHYAR